MPDYHAQLARLKAKLPQARAADLQLKVFGAKGHKYRITGPVAEGDLQAFEQRYGVELPADYRQFMREIGPGAGPFYGLYAPGTHANALCGQPETLLRQPSRWHPRMSTAEWDALTLPFEDEEMPDADYERETDALFAGLLPIGSQGCTYYHALVLAGPHRGRVVNLDVERYLPRFAYETNFLDWYERWLDETIDGTLLRDGPTWFGYQRGGTEAQLAAGFRAATDPTEQAEYLMGFIRLAAADPATVALLAEASASPHPGVARQALALLTKFDYQRARPLLKALWASDPLRVYELLHWYAKPHAEEWVPELQATLTAPEVSNRLFDFATYVAEACATDLSALIRPWVAHPNQKLGKQAAYVLQKMASRPKPQQRLWRFWERMRK